MWSVGPTEVEAAIMETEKIPDLFHVHNVDVDDADGTYRMHCKVDLHTFSLPKIVSKTVTILDDRICTTLAHTSDTQCLLRLAGHQVCKK